MYKKIKTKRCVIYCLSLVSDHGNNSHNIPSKNPYCQLTKPVHIKKLRISFYTNTCSNSHGVFTKWSLIQF